MEILDLLICLLKNLYASQVKKQQLEPNMEQVTGSKLFKPGFNSMWTENFQIFKLDLEKAEEPEI